MKQTGSSNLGVVAVVALAVVIVVGVYYLRSTPEPEPQSPVTIESSGTADDTFGRPRAPGFGNTERDEGGSATDRADGAGAPVRKDLGAESMRMRDQGVGEPVAERDALEDDPEDVPSLRRVALEDPDPERRLAAVTLLGISEDPDAIPALAEALNDEDEDVRMEAVLSLSDFTDEAPVDALAQALSDPSPDIRYEALDVLSDIETPEAKTVVEKALDDPDEDVRELAEVILEMWTDDEDF